MCCNSVLSDTDRRRRCCGCNGVLGVTNECGRVLGASNGFCNNGVLGVTNECSNNVLGITNECNNVLETSANIRFCCCRCVCCCGTWC